tara:strand:+ start:300 stop:467 length:168 start_codon:yes stop_codon:yes gene_type:complete
MKKIKWELVLEKEIGSVGVTTFPTKEKAEEERDNRNRLCIAMCCSPDVRYIIREV